MRKTPLLAAVIFAATVSGAPEFAAAMGSNNPTPPQSSKPSGSTTKQKTKKDKSSSAKDFLDRYHAAYALIYDKGDFGGGIPRYAPWAMTTMRTWQRCSGYASRKLGRYDDAKYWYDKALAADPNHALT